MYSLPKNMAVVIEAEPYGEESKLIGVGRYHTDPATNYAETAFVIRDDWQGASLGTSLLHHLIDIARDAARARVAFDAIEVLAKSTVFSSVRRREDEGGGGAERGESARHRSDDFN